MIIDLSPSHVMALADILLEHIRRAGHTERYVDVARQVETTPEDLLSLFVDAGAGIPIRSSALAVRVRYNRVGGHVHCRVFTAKATVLTFAKCGDLTFSVGEWPTLVEMLAPVVEFVPEEL